MPTPPAPRGIERLTDLPIALGVRGAGALLGRAGPRSAYRFARLAGDVWWHAAPGRRAIALRNLEIAFRGGLTPAERARIARESCRHAMATAVGVFLRERAIEPDHLGSFFEPHGLLDEVLDRPRPRGLVILSAHLGDWEMVHYYLALRGLPVAAVARRIHNPHLDRLAVRLRTVRGASVIAKEGGLLAMARILRAGGAVGLMPDQSAPPGERQISFFGARAATYFQYARLLARMGPEAVFVVAVRDRFEFRFRIEARDLSAALLGSGSEDDRAERVVRGYLSTLEDAVRATPEQYLWVHRRWKYRPPGAPDLYERLGEPLGLRILAEERSPESTGKPAEEPRWVEEPGPVSR